MKTGNWMVMGLAVSVLGLSVIGANAEPPRGKRFKHADKNNDGKIGPKEWKAEKQWEHKQKAKVNTPQEARMDKDNDGVVEPAEARRARARVYLKEKSAVDRPWEAAADANNDGKVGPAELRIYHRKLLDKINDGTIDAAERHAYWLARKRKVNTEAEKRHDANGDGWIDAEEAQEMLKDLLRVINTNGKAIVNTPIEAEYDADGDGIIDAEEAEVLKEALGIS